VILFSWNEATFWELLLLREVGKRFQTTYGYRAWVAGETEGGVWQNEQVNDLIIIFLLQKVRISKAPLSLISLEQKSTRALKIGWKLSFIFPKSVITLQTQGGLNQWSQPLTHCQAGRFLF
jgi:hypothetical protein